VNNKRVGVVGARGHTGSELLAILDRHPDVAVVHAGSRELAGVPVPEIDGLEFENLTPDEVAALSLDGLFLALPDGVSEQFVDVTSPETVIVDISSDHRFDDRWVYGLPELFRDKISGARRIANPGCYATVMQLAIAPFKDDLGGVPAVFGVSGFSGSGTTPSPMNDPERLRDNLMPYKLVGHNHEREATRYLDHPVRFMPHVHPTFRGLLVTAHIPVVEQTDLGQAIKTLRDRYVTEPLIAVQDQAPELRDGTNLIGAVLGGLEVSEDGHNIVIVGAEDNLLKGAAVQAIQNLNLALGFHELAGIL